MKSLGFIFLIISFFGCSTAPKFGHKHPNKLVIAHRSAPGYLPEHTLEGVAMAHAWGVDYIEPDVVMTRDNHLVILHDTHLDTTTNVAKIFPKRKRKDGRFYAIDFTLREIKKLNVHERMNLKTGERYFPKRFPNQKSNFKVPTLEEYIELVQGLNETTGKQVGIYVEYKSPAFHAKHGKKIDMKLLKVLKKYGYDSPKSGAIIQCFDAKFLKKMSKMTSLPLVQLIGANKWKESDTDYDKMMTPAGLKEVSSYADGIGPWMTYVLLNENLVKEAHKNGLYVHTYTLRKEQVPPDFKSIDELHEMLYFKRNVDGLFTDFGDLTLNFLNSK